MLKKDLFRLLIKLFALYQLTLMPYTFSAMFSAFVFAYGDFLMIFAVVFTVILVVAFFILLIAYPDVVIRLLKLDKGFDEDDIKLVNLDMRKVITVAIIILGGTLVVYNFSFLLIAAVNFLQSLASRSEFDLFMTNDNKQNFYIDLINFTIGLLLLTNYRRIATYLLKQEKEED